MTALSDLKTALAAQREHAENPGCGLYDETIGYDLAQRVIDAAGALVEELDEAN